MRRLIFTLCLSTLASASEVIRVRDYLLEVPQGWESFQTARDAETELFGFTNGKETLNLLVYKGTFSDISQFVGRHATEISHAPNQVHNFISWTTLDTEKKTPHDGRAGVPATSFLNTFRGNTYFGYARGSSLKVTRATANSFLDGFRKSIPLNRSLTDLVYSGAKFYLGFGDLLSGSMGNEVKFDIQHTHDIFTKQVGGNYQGKTFISDGGAAQVRARWKEIAKVMGPHDMYVQYSSGHGYPGGLAFGLTYDEIRDQVLAFRGKEMIVFLMACHSGGLVDSFNRKKEVWKNWQAQGKTLMVMASSTVDQTSSTGPGIDPEQPSSPSGSAGSAFGHALWKALIGHADGSVDGITDGYISLSEIRTYTKAKTQQVGGHTPVTTGAYQENLVLNRVPPKSFRDELVDTSENLSLEEVAERVQALDAEFRLH